MIRPGVIVTRPADQADRLAAELERRGYAPILAPALALEAVEGPALDLAGVAAFAVTSANGARALARRTAERALPVFAVGGATRAAAEAEGFRHVEEAEGDGASLARLIAPRLGALGGAILHASGDHIAFDLVAALEPRGGRVRRETVYRMAAAPALPGAAIAALRAGTARAVTLMSARTARAFGDLAREAGLAGALGALDAICLADQVARAAAPYHFASVHAAATPDMDSLLSVLEAVTPRD